MLQRKIIIAATISLLWLLTEVYILSEMMNSLHSVRAERGRIWDAYCEFEASWLGTSQSE